MFAIGLYYLFKFTCISMHLRFTCTCLCVCGLGFGGCFIFNAFSVEYEKDVRGKDRHTEDMPRDILIIIFHRQTEK